MKDEITVMPAKVTADNSDPGIPSWREPMSWIPAFAAVTT